ncbi:MAG TPA: hypothetical protein VFC45_01950, partial [Pseudolabrys sp.]|nr:hypothetical protein [Pseudolabrys sp.]
LCRLTVTSVSATASEPPLSNRAGGKGAAFKISSQLPRPSIPDFCNKIIQKRTSGFGEQLHYSATRLVGEFKTDG